MYCLVEKKMLISITILLMVLALLMDSADSDVCVEKRITQQVPKYRSYPIRFRKHSIIPYTRRLRPGFAWNMHRNPFIDYDSDYNFESPFLTRFPYGDFDEMVDNDIKLIIECGNNNNITLPLIFPDKPQCYSCKEISLHIKHLNGSLIPDRAFTEFKEITGLHLDNLGIKYISEGAFEDLENCMEIYLTGNNISSLLPGVFKGLNKLKTLDLSYNVIKELNYELLNTSKDHSVALNMSHNQIDFVDGEIFEQKFPCVSALDLSFNKIFNIKFDQIPIRITDLDLSYNLISSINGCIYKISKLILSHNNIKSLQNECLNNSQAMRYLDLSHNQISTLNFHTFPDNFGINVLLMQYNIIKNISSGTFSNCMKLEILNLSHNKIDFLPVGSFENLGNLMTLDLSNNLLKKLNLNIFNSFKSLKEFYLQDNAISDFHYNIILHRFPKLQSINLNNNNVSCEYLMQMVFHLEKNAVSFVSGATKYSENVHGIPCYSKLIPVSSIKHEGKLEKSVQGDFTATSGDHQQTTIFWITIVIMMVLLLILAFQTYFIYYKCQLRKLNIVEMT